MVHGSGTESRPGSTGVGSTAKPAADPTRVGESRENERGDPGRKDGDAQSPPEGDGGDEKGLLSGNGRNKEGSPAEQGREAGD